MRAVAGRRAQIRRQTSKPSMSGRLTSSTTRSELALRPSSSASLPVAGFDDVEAGGAQHARWSSSASAGLSSTTRIVARRSSAMVGPQAAAPARRGRRRAVGSWSGIVTENVEPTPSSLSTADVAAEQLRQLACSATGPGRCRAAASGSATRPARSPGRSRRGVPAAMPMPVSATANVTRSSSSSVARRRAPRPSA